jgi:hypothetical protein
MVITASAIVSAAAWLRPSWGFQRKPAQLVPAADEAALAQFREPLNVTVYLAAEDPRLVDLERNILEQAFPRTVPRLKSPMRRLADGPVRTGRRPLRRGLVCAG